MTDNCDRRLSNNQPSDNQPSDSTQRCGLPRGHDVTGFPQVECLPAEDCLASSLTPSKAKRASSR